MTKPFPALCKDCCWSKPEERSEWCLRCHHPKVNSTDAWALSAASTNMLGGGTSCTEERRKRGLFVQCGMKGKLWEKRVDDAV